MRAVLGGEQPKQDKGMTPEQMAEYLEACPDEVDSYDDASRWAGRGVLRYLRQHPEAFANGDAGDVFDAAFADQRGEPDEDEDGYRALPEQIEGITGFMVGWAVNAARYAMNHNPVSNPAIFDLGE